MVMVTDDESWAMTIDAWWVLSNDSDELWLKDGCDQWWLIEMAMEREINGGSSNDMAMVLEGFGSKPAIMRRHNDILKS